MRCYSLNYFSNMRQHVIHLSLFLIISGHSRKQKLSSKFALKVCRVVNNNKSLIETLDQVGTSVSQPTVQESCIKGVFMDVSVERHRCSNKKMYDLCKRSN